MPMNNREKIMIGGLIAAGSVIGLGMLLVAPAWQAVSDNQAKITQLETDVKTLQDQENLIKVEVARLSKGVALPPHLVIRKFNGNSLEKNLKEMQNQVIQLATGSGNELISLEPLKGAEVTTVTPEPEEEKKDDKDKKEEAKKDEKTADGKEVAKEPATPGLKLFGYELAFRGSYDNILEFLSSLNHHNELIEISNVKLENEGGPERSDSPSSRTMLKPIKLTLHLKLVMQPEGT